MAPLQHLLLLLVFNYQKSKPFYSFILPLLLLLLSSILIRVRQFAISFFDMQISMLSSMPLFVEMVYHQILTRFFVQKMK